MLVHGAFDREGFVEAAPVTETVEPPSSQPALHPDLEKTPLTYESDYWLQIAEGTRAKFALISSKEVPAVVVAPELAIGPIRAADELVLDRRARRLAEEHAALGVEKPPQKNSPPGEAGAQGQPGGEWPEKAGPYRLLATDSSYRLALFQLANEVEEPFSLVSPARFAPGSFVAAITLEPERRLRINPGYVVSVTPGTNGNQQGQAFDVSFDVADLPHATALVDLDGNLAGLTVRGEDGAGILPAPRLFHLVEELRTQAPCVSIETADVPGDVGELLGISGGAFVEKVHSEAFVPEPSIRPGDVILRWDGRRVENASQFGELYAEQRPGSLVRYVVLRDRQRVGGGTVMPGPDCRPMGRRLLALVRAGALLELQEDKSAGDGSELGWRVRAVVEESPATEGGLQADDWVVAANGKNLTRDNAERSFAAFENRGSPLVLSVRRGDRLKLVLLKQSNQPSS